MRENKLKGFSLAELVIGIAIMGFIIISVLAVFFNGINAIKKGRYQSSAVNMLESKISQTRLILIETPQLLGRSLHDFAAQRHLPVPRHHHLAVAAHTQNGGRADFLFHEAVPYSTVGAR